MPVYVSDDVEVLVEVNVDAIPSVFRTQKQLAEAGVERSEGRRRTKTTANTACVAPSLH
jgi:hypothetical protein